MNGVTDDELRELVRASIARTGGGLIDRRVLSVTPAELPQSAPPDQASFSRFPLARGSDTDGACLIEPAVRCSHCGYCVSYGH